MKAVCDSSKSALGLTANGSGLARNGPPLGLFVKDSGLTVVSGQQRNETTGFARRPGKEVVLGHSANRIGLVKSNGSARDFPVKHVPIASSRPSGNQAATGRVDAENKNGKGKFGNSGGSWADKVRISSGKSRFSLDSGFAQEHGQAEYTLPDELIEEDFEEWTRCLVGFIPGSSFPFHAIRTIAQKEWNHYGLKSVSSYEDFFLFRFHNEEKVHEILADGPWLFGGKFMMLQQWHACFVFDKSKITKVPVWIRLKGLPFTLWSHKALSFVASIIGKPLSCDKATHEKSRLSYARVCVEVDADKPYVHNFDLKCKLSNVPIRISVEYEWKPQRCPRCCVYGHNCEAGKVVEENAKGEHGQRNAGHANKGNLVLTDMPGSGPNGINNEESAGANEKSNSAQTETSGADHQRVDGRVLGLEENGDAVGTEGTPSSNEGAIKAPTGLDNTTVTATIEEGPTGRLDEDRLITTSRGQRELNSLALITNDMGRLVDARVVDKRGGQQDRFSSVKQGTNNDTREELLSTDCAYGEQKQKEARLIKENCEAQKREMPVDGMATGGAYELTTLVSPSVMVDTEGDTNLKESLLVETLDGHCRLNSAASPGSSKENGIITPERKASTSTCGILDSKGSWADKVRKSQNEDSSNNLEGSTSKAAYNLRPQRPTRKNKMKRGPRPPN